MSNTKALKINKTYQGEIHYYWKEGISNGHPSHSGVLSERVFEINEEIVAFADDLCKKEQYPTLRIDSSACTQFEVVSFIANNEYEIDNALSESLSFLSNYHEISDNT